MSNTQEVKARCLCGHYQLSLTVSKDRLPLTASVCHCDSCRHALGSLYVGVAYVPESCLETVQDSLSKLKASQWSSRRTAYFCPTCGSTIIDILDDQVMIHTGSLDQLMPQCRFNVRYLSRILRMVASVTGSKTCRSRHMLLSTTIRPSTGLKQTGNQ